MVVVAHSGNHRHTGEVFIKQAAQDGVISSVALVNHIPGVEDKGHFTGGEFLKAAGEILQGIPNLPVEPFDEVAAARAIQMGVTDVGKGHEHNTSSLI